MISGITPVLIGALSFYLLQQLYLLARFFPQAILFFPFLLLQTYGNSARKNPTFLKKSFYK